MFSKYIWLLPLFLSILLYSNDYLNNITFNFMNKWLNITKTIYSNLDKKLNIKPNLDINQKVFTSSELKKYTNLEDGLYISILGHVFDVTKGAKHYGPGATYHAFTGKIYIETAFIIIFINIYICCYIYVIYIFRT